MNQLWKKLRALNTWLQNTCEFLFTVLTLAKTLQRKWKDLSISFQGRSNVLFLESVTFVVNSLLMTFHETKNLQKKTWRGYLYVILMQTLWSNVFCSFNDFDHDLVHESISSAKLKRKKNLVAFQCTVQLHTLPYYSKTFSSYIIFFMSLH